MLFNWRENILSRISIIFDSGITGLPGIFDVFGSLKVNRDCSNSEHQTIRTDRVPVEAPYRYCDVDFEMAYANMMGNMPLRIKIYAVF